MTADLSSAVYPVRELRQIVSERGEDVAADLQAKINALAGVGQLEAGNLAFLNATVEFRNNKFFRPQNCRPRNFWKYLFHTSD